MRLRAIAIGLLAMGLTAPTVGSAQGSLTAVITVDDRAITQFELTQRIRLLEFFNTAGDLNKIAREQLIEDRLKERELDRFNRDISPDDLQRELQEFAGRGGLSLAEFAAGLQRNNVEVRTFVEYVSTGSRWRDFIRARFNREVTVTDADVERILARQGSATTQLEVLLTEIIIPAPPERAARVREVATQISQLRSFSEFENAARQVSALPSREDGGRLGWLPIENYPPQLRQVLLDLRPGEVTEPIEIPNAVALFQKRGQREARRAARAPASLEYALYYIPGGQSDAARRTAAEVRNQVDTCDDLYGVARNQPAQVLERMTLPPSQIPDDVAIELARLDAGEVSYNITRNGGETLVFLMLCARNNVDTSAANRDAVIAQIRSQRLGALSSALLEDLRASAVIRP